MKPSYPVGSPVLIVGNPSQHNACLGLYGYVSKVYPDPKDGMWVEMFRSHETQPSETSKEWPRFESTSVFHIQPSDLRPLTGKARLVRVARLKAFKDKEKRDRKPDPKWDALMADLSSPATVTKRKAEDEAIAAERARIGEVFKLPGRIERGDKSAFPAYRDPIVKAISDELQGYAHKGPKACTLTERARWPQCLEAIDATSFWSPRAAQEQHILVES